MAALFDLPRDVAVRVGHYLRLDDVRRAGFASRAAASVMLNHDADGDDADPVHIRRADLWAHKFREAAGGGVGVVVPPNPKARLLDEIGRGIEKRKRELRRRFQLPRAHAGYLTFCTTGDSDVFDARGPQQLAGHIIVDGVLTEVARVCRYARGEREHDDRATIVPCRWWELREHWPSTPPGSFYASTLRQREQVRHYVSHCQDVRLTREIEELHDKLRILKARRAQHRMFLEASRNIIAGFDRELGRDAAPFRAPLAAWQRKQRRKQKATKTPPDDE